MLSVTFCKRKKKVGLFAKLYTGKSKTNKNIVNGGNFKTKFPLKYPS